MCSRRHNSVTACFQLQQCQLLHPEACKTALTICAPSLSLPAAYTTAAGRSGSRQRVTSTVGVPQTQPDDSDIAVSLAWQGRTHRCFSSPLV